jgi:hypothetical protein
VIKKLMLLICTLTIALSTIVSGFVTPIVATDDEHPVIQDLCWWSNISDITPGTKFLLAPDINALSSSNSFTLAEDSVAYGLTIPAFKDTSIGYCSNWGPDANNGDKISFVAWNNSPTADLNSLIEFGLESLPANAEIYQASLALYAFNYDGYSNIPVGVYKQLHTDWEELQATYNIYKTGSGWTTQGGDYVTSDPAGVVMMIPAASQGWVQWDILDIVNDARNRGIPVELLIKATVYGNAHSSAGFCSKEYYQDTWLQPKLLIGYILPTPPTPTPTPTPAEPWSFAIITDTHIGENYCNENMMCGDYGGTGWDDSGSAGQEYSCAWSGEDWICGLPIPSVWNLKIAVGWTNKASNPNDPCFLNVDFVAVDGDITDSAEMSEFGKAKEILDKLNTPWIPIMGNHDVWPYTSSEEAPAVDLDSGNDIPDGAGTDYYFYDMFKEVYDTFPTRLAGISEWNVSAVPVFNSKLDPQSYSYFKNFAFTYKDYRFIGLDFNCRQHTNWPPPFSNGKGVNPNAELFTTSNGTLPNGTWEWFTNNLDNWITSNQGGQEDVMLFAHHPMIEFRKGIQWSFDLEWQLCWMFDYMEQYKNRGYVEFGGHLHDNHVDQNYYQELLDVVRTDANKDDPMVRIVQVFPNGTIDYDTLLPRDAASIMAHCPVDLILTDPDGLVINRSENQVPDAMYYKWDFDEDGQLETKIWIPERKPGNYSIQVIPESYANESDTFTLTVSPMEQKWGYAPITIAQNVSISNIPAEPYTFEFTQRTATNISYTGDVSGYNFDTINLTAVLSTEDGSLLSGKTINFVIGNQTASAVTDVNGVATASITLNQTPSEFYYVEYGFDGDTDYLPYYDAQPFVIPPVADASGPYTGTEGSPITLSGSGTYDPEGRAISYEWDLDNDGIYDDATGVAPAYTWNDDYADYISLRVTDDNGATSTATTTVTVNNTPPTVAAGADINNAITGTAINFNGSFTDPGTLDTHTIAWNFGDGSSTVNGTLTPSHTYSSSGNYIATLTVTDDDGGVGTDTLTINTMLATTTYTFTIGGGTNKWCSAGHIHLIDWNNGHPHSPSDLAASPTYGFVSGGSTEYAQISSSDNVRWKSSISHNLGCCSFDRNAELFTFKIAENPSTITNIQIKWEGHGTTGETIYYTTEKLWNTSMNSWSTINNKKNVTGDVTWTNNISNSCSDYIDSTGNLSVLIAAQRSGLPNNCGIWTDYIEVRITH